MSSSGLSWRGDFLRVRSSLTPGLQIKAHPRRFHYPLDIHSLGIIACELLLRRLRHGHVHLALMPKGLQKILAKTLQPDLEILTRIL